MAGWDSVLCTLLLHLPTRIKQLRYLGSWIFELELAVLLLLFAANNERQHMQQYSYRKVHDPVLCK